MKKFIFSFMVLLAYAAVNVAYPSDNYKLLRKKLLDNEKRLLLGANQTMDDVEISANKVLMKAKDDELRFGFNDARVFLPSRSFLEVKEEIDKSKVFQLIRRMPKGAVLHAHDSSFVNANFVYNNLTFRNDLYVCVVNDDVKLHFFRVPDDTCKWELLKKVREDPVRGNVINDMIKERLSMKQPNASYPNTDVAWEKFRKIFAFMDPLLRYKPIYEEYFLEGLRQLYEDNVMYLELRSTLPVMYDFDGTRYQPEDTIMIYKDLVHRFKEQHPDFIGAKLIYAPKRFANQGDTKKYFRNLREFRELFPDFVIGFDLVGQEDKGHTLEYYSSYLRKAADQNISFFFHAGETNWLGAPTDENLIDALLLKTRRIGHGYAMASHPFLVKLAKRMNIAIEVNPISNQVLKLVDDLRNHAARPLFSEGYPLVVSCDDPGLWDATGLSYDFYEAFMALMSAHANLKSLKQLAINSLTYSSLGDDEKEQALKLWHKKWRDFVTEVASQKQ